SLGRLVLGPHLNTYRPDWHLLSNLRSWWDRGRIAQIKARHFEIPAAGGFLLTEPADDLSQFFSPGKEIALYQNTGELIEKIKYYLAHDAERKAIASAGHARVLKDHTYAARFRAIFKTLGLE